jgi:hypothetical protein
MFSSEIAMLGALVSMLVFVGFLWGVQRIFIWLWARLPSRLVSIQTEQLDKTLAVLFALVLFPGIVFYGWSVIVNLIRFISWFISATGSWLVPPSCNGDSSSCASDAARSVAVLLGNASTRIVEAINLSSFPVPSFLWFLLTAVLATQVIGFVRKEAAAGSVRNWYRSVPSVVQQRIAFAMLVLGSFYLGLSALLAIPLLQEKAGSDQLTADALNKALEANIMKPEVFNQQFPSTFPKLEPASPGLKIVQVSSPGSDTTTSTSKETTGFAGQVFESAFRQKENVLEDLQNYYAALRSAALNDPERLREQARNIFAAGLQISEGKKQAAKHYYELIKWHETVTQDKYIVLRNCQDAVQTFFTSATQQLHSFRTALEADAHAGDEVIADVFNQFQRAENGENFSKASAGCIDQKDENSEPADVPDRPSFADTLGPVGGWTRWLLDTEQMPLVIIVGLVGFSLLGATVSRAVRGGLDRPLAAITLDDLLIVIAGGTTAAIVVFLAAYGGLALLGTTGGDPNPYVVFVTCLIGAVYSEDVWARAREKFLKPTSQTQQARGGGEEKNEKETKPDDPNVEVQGAREVKKKNRR